MTWTGLHCRVNWKRADVDTFVADSLAPLMAGREWFFLRYWETGPHLRVRVQGDPGDLRSELADLVAAQDFATTADEPGWLPHGDVREVEYVPETARYGGPAALPVAERLFCRSTEVAVAVLQAARTESGRLTAALQLTMTTAKALGLDLPQAASWLRTLGTGWRTVTEWAPAPTIGSHLAAHQLLAQRGQDLADRWHRDPTGVLAHWAGEVRAAREELGTWLPHVWASQLHMLLNRLGIGPNEERLVCWTTAAAALSPTGLTDFHADGATAPDRRYLEASKFLPGFGDQLPRTPAPAPQFAPWLPTVPLQSTVDEMLASAFRARRTSRELQGTLTADQLGTMLWTAMAPSDGRRPYPSAGARYCARLRLIALDVDGLAPGRYEVDETNRTLIRLGDAPSVDDLEATSMWFGKDRTELTGTPAVLALYVRIGLLRESYGLRALRFAFTEAGHLAQNLTVTAAHGNIRTGLVGGFYDDLAHDVIGLDGVDDTLVYFLPLAS
ncbi:thiopeptide-type bacteriocin biosynthesis domain-containing protein [Lentzea fradiae]|uniref:Thiopeptide-type bacteriocin biosynthesis domain-containing protein n=1 Tax=Lentzea fradiae TaxID=200378 RepID=A0A1G7NZU3_9PSEU|nr:thiopeptide-type bacteriocin biosynthesis protein [Lentzea fradiae]SDF79566.1 thiopeptide-type bacteriocin biosynthesis domain-containing protein [Lentzea fradiae]